MNHNLVLDDFCHKNVLLFRRIFSSLVITFLLIANNLAVADQTFKIGLATWGGYPESVRGFKKGLEEAGLIEGKNLTFLTGGAVTDQKNRQQIVNSFIEAKVDLVYSLTTGGTVVVKELIPKTTPIVFSIVTYPADSGLIESFEYSGNNLVGTSNYVPTLQYLKLLKLIIPSVKTIAIFHRKDEPNSKIQTANILRLLKREGIKGIDREPENIEQVRLMAMELVGQVDAFMTTTDTLMQSGGEQVLIDVSLNSNIPILSSNKLGIEQGSSFGPVADFYILGQMAGAKAAKILLEGAEPTKIQTELQEPPLFLVNRASLDKLGIKLSPEAQKLIKWVN